MKVPNVSVSSLFTFCSGSVYSSHGKLVNIFSFNKIVVFSFIQYIFCVMSDIVEIYFH